MPVANKGREGGSGGGAERLLPGSPDGPGYDRVGSKAGVEAGRAGVGFAPIRSSRRSRQLLGSGHCDPSRRRPRWVDSRLSGFGAAQVQAVIAGHLELAHRRMTALGTDAVRCRHSFSIEPTIFSAPFRSFRIGPIAPIPGSKGSLPGHSVVTPRQPHLDGAYKSRLSN
jgi:hypothetical protein